MTLAVRPLGIPHTHPDRAVSPEEDLALELEGVVTKFRQLRDRVHATPGLRSGLASASLGELVSQTVALAQAVAPHMVTNLGEEQEVRGPRVVGAAGATVEVLDHPACRECGRALGYHADDLVSARLCAGCDTASESW